LFEGITIGRGKETTDTVRREGEAPLADTYAS